MTEGGLVHAEQTGAAIAVRHDLPITLLYGGTRRSRETAEALRRGIDRPELVEGPLDSFALRNPDMYVAGTRVNMVSSAQTLAEQVPGMNDEQAGQNQWWATFFAAPDRIGWWLGHDDPPGETGSDLTNRILRFVRSIADPGPLQGRLVICATHSPLLRALLMHANGVDPGEPAYVTGVQVVLGHSAEPTMTAYDPLDA